MEGTQPDINQHFLLFKVLCVSERFTLHAGPLRVVLSRATLSD